jgi:cell wall-associated NlpC family hydrolase
LLTQDVVATALVLRGTPYRFGGSDPRGFDCSGLVQWVFRQHGVVLPREARDQYQAGATIESDALEPGDLVFFNTEGNGASHVGIVLDQESFVHAPNSRGVVRVERLGLDYWSKRYLGARRVR